MEDTVIVQDDLTRKTAYKLTISTHKTYRMIFFLLAVLETFLGIRFFFKLFGANPGSWFVAFIYFISDVFLFPFWGVFQRGAASGPGVQKIFEPSTVVAGIIYLLLAWGASRLLLIIRSKPVAEGKDND